MAVVYQLWENASAKSIWTSSSTYTDMYGSTSQAHWSLKTPINLTKECFLPSEGVGFGKYFFLGTPSSGKEYINSTAWFKPSGLIYHQFFTTVIKKTQNLISLDFPFS